LAFARETLSRYEELERELGVLKAVGQGTLVLAASTIPGEYVLPALLAAFREEYPRIRVEMSVSDTADVATKLLEDEADVGMIGSRPRRPGLRLERLVGDEVILAVPPGHAMAERTSVGIDNLRNQRLILREQGSGTRRSVEEALVPSGTTLSQEDAALILGSSQAVLQAVEQGLGIGFLSARAAEAALADGRVVRVSLEGIDLRRDLYLAYVPERLGDPLVGRFLKFARERFAE
jgi:DNA-binding transcriptional LysR family regulator